MANAARSSGSRRMRQQAPMTRRPNKRLKLTAHVGVFDLSPVRCSLSAIRYAASVRGAQPRFRDAF
jgi:hypothetical protein